MTHSAEQFDIVLAGGGATGLSFLLALQHCISNTKPRVTSPLKVAMVEAWSPESAQTHPGFDARAIALSQQTLAILSRFNLNNAVQGITTAIKHIQVSDHGGAGQCTLNHSDYQVNELGAVIEAHQLGKMLSDAVSQQLDAKLIQLFRFQPEQITGVEQTRDYIATTLKSGLKISAKLLILAEGGQSSTREQLPIQVTSADYQHSAIIANVVTEKAHNNAAYERFTENGPLAFLPMSDNRSGVVWSVASSDTESLLLMTDETFIKALQSQFGYRLGKITKVGQRGCFPLALVRADDELAHRAVCIGNAAQTLHPIAGQGFNLAIRDAWSLAATLVDAVNRGIDFGSFKALSTYRKSRQQDKQNTVLLTDGLVRLFSNKNPLLQAGRNLGLMAMQLNQSGKTAFANIAMGKKAQLETPLKSNLKGVIKHD